MSKFVKSKLSFMEGIMYVTDEKNKRRFVQIDLNKYGSLWEDIYDGLLAESRKSDDRISLEDLKKELGDEGFLSAGS